jgi:hypothetical protein
LTDGGTAAALEALVDFLAAWEASMLSTILIIILILLLVGALPRWGYHRRGYGPSGLLGVLLVVILILLLLHRI